MRGGPGGDSVPHSVTATLAVRLGAWREWRARWGLFAVAAACAIVGPLLPEEIALGWPAFSLLMVLPALVCVVAAGGPATTDAFWRGLGGPAWARQAGAFAVHLVGLGLPVGVLCLFQARIEDRWIPLYLSALFATYGSVRAARAMSAGMRVVVGPILAGVLVAASVGVGSYLALWNPWEALGVRLVAVGLVGLAAAPWLEERFGPWGAAVRRGGVHAVVSLLVLAFAGGAAAEVASAGFAESGVSNIAFDATRVLRVRWRGRGWMANAEVTLDEGGEERSLGHGVDGSLGPRGAWVMEGGTVQTETTAGSISTWGTVRPFLRLQGVSGTVECPIEVGGCGTYNWRGDGDAVAAWCGLETWVLDVAAGCERVPMASVAWMGNRRVELHDGVVSVEGREVARLEVRKSFPDEVPGFLHSAGGTVLAWTRSPRRVVHIQDSGAEIVFEHWSAYTYQGGDTMCARAPGRSVCWRPDGTAVEAEGALLDPDHVFQDGVVRGLVDGRVWRLPGDQRWSQLALRFVAPDEIWGQRREDIVRVRPE